MKAYIVTHIENDQTKWLARQIERLESQDESLMKQHVHVNYPTRKSVRTWIHNALVYLERLKRGVPPDGYDGDDEDNASSGM